MPAVERTSDPKDDPISVSEAKDHSRVTRNADDDYLQGLIRAATRRAERFCRSGFVKQTWRDSRDAFPVGDVWELPRGPVFSTTGVVVRYRPSTGGTLTFDSTNYIVDDRSLFGRVVLKDTASWPSTELQNAVGAEVTWEVGYSTGPDSVPEDIKHALKLAVASNYEHREDVVVGSAVGEMPNTAEDLLRGYRVPEVPR